MRPRIFIGSSTQAQKYAGAIHDNLSNDAECTVWTEDAFGLAGPTVLELIKNLRDSDFGVFVFAPDDTATINEELLSITRDNVVYEAGLFSGYLSPQRCFIVIPRATKIRMPSDLLGITVGRYEDDRTDNKPIRAVASFCRQVKEKIVEMGLFTGNPYDRLNELVVKFDCTNWLPEDKARANPWEERVKRKHQVTAEIDAFVKTNTVNRHRLLASGTTSHYIVLLRAITNNPDEGDCALIRQLDHNLLPSGFARWKLLDAVEALKKKMPCTTQQVATLRDWLKNLPFTETDIRTRIDAF